MKKIIMCTVAALGALLAATATAQTWPSKPIRLINPYAPGGFGDTVARPMFDQLAQSLGQPIIVESQAGANGTLASNVVAKAAPDGYTILIANLGPIAMNPVLYPATTADPLKVFVPITQLVSGPLVILAHPDFPAKTLQELMDYARANPGKVSYGSVGPGSTTHLAGELLALKGKLDLLHVPFKGAAPVITNLLGKQVDIGIVNISLAKPHIDAGRLRPIAVTTLKRSSIFPAVPTVAEALPGFEVNPWWGLMAPVGTPSQVITRVEQEMIRILKIPAIAAKLRESGLEPEGTTASAYGKVIAADIDQWREVVKANKISLQ
ncbi:tripartite tricarboxylate transporter substrate binding protein [Alcaligenaceae bacterium LF4-65]|jgi:tripartite-type tricarboxylate transporter receptor subunit TctC|uniref:Tripartite tricarboxylate transporter substrate binding protein n=1 Tax=Zwartia hollandica TaxID=324606 RepID=A0A953T686_9BURK|nr:tripartite tricarboxylate transporter substrate binding protein [Zwartia hollandica]MBZ1349564.1 tripartite tricarboxylate transporter substrate binding protein [Zwartia hollandica]